MNDSDKAVTEISIVRWCGWEQSLVVAPNKVIGGLGGFFDRGMRWSDYASIWVVERLPYIEAIRSAVLKEGLRFGGGKHQVERVPIFSDGTAGRFSYRAWGDLMAAIWSEEEDVNYNYMDFYL